MKHLSPVRPRLRAWLATLLTALLVSSGLSLGATAASAAPGDVSAATLDWGIKQSFRNYISGPIAHGGWALSGSVTGSFSWSGGRGSAEQSAATGSVGYDGSIHFTGHQNPATGNYSLDLTLSNVRVQQRSAAGAVIIVDSVSNSMANPTTFVTSTDVVFAAVDLAAATNTSDAETVSYTAAPAALTAAGAAAFAGFYGEGTALDPVSFSWPVEQATTPQPAVPTVTVSKTAEISPAGELVTVTGSGFTPNAPATSGTRNPLLGKFGGVYIVFGKFAEVWQPSSGAASSTRTGGSTAWAVNAEDVAAVGGARRGAVAIGADGTFSVQLLVSRGFTGEPATGTYGIYTYSGGGAVYAPFETATPIAFTPATATTLALSASPSAGLVEGDATTLTATVTPSAAGTVTFREGTTVLGTAPADAASVQLSSLTAGAHSYTAEFVPSSPLLFAGSTASADLSVAAKQVAVAGSLTWGVKDSFRSYITGPIARGYISTSRVGTAGGAFVFGQSTGGSFTATSGVGTATYAGSVRFYGHEGQLDVTIANPVVSVDSASRGTLYATVNGRASVPFATLDLASASRSTAGSAVSYSSVPATLTGAGAAVFSFNGSTFYGAGTALDPVAFTIGSAAAATSGGTTTVAAFLGDRQPAATPPATTGVELAPQSLKNLVAGGEVTITASGFEPDETGIMIVIYSTPVVLARDVTADSAGVVTWTGRLPAALTGQHTLTIQGSVDRGVVLDIPARIATAAEGCRVQGASLSWGFKESFRSYISGTIANGQWTVAEGASYATPNFGWAAGAGAYDRATGEGLVAFAGSITFTGHGGILNTTVANPQLRFIDADSAVILLDVSGTTQDGSPVDQKAVEFVELDLSAATVDDDAGTLTITGAPAVLTAAGAQAFGTYPAGEQFDPVSVQLPLDAGCAAVLPSTETAAPVDAGSSQSQSLWWVLWLVLALVVVAALIAVIVFRRRAQRPVE